jgi:ATP-dependent DNA helicase RecG
MAYKQVSGFIKDEKMKQTQLEPILQEGKGALIEFKQSFSPSIIKDIVAFANTAGGRIFIGINDNNDIIGCSLTNEIKSRIQDIGNNCTPRIPLQIESITCNNKTIIVINVPENPDKPVQCSEGFFFREGANSQKIQRNEIFSYAQKSGKIRFENQFRTDFKYPEDFNEIAFNNLIRRLGITHTGIKEDLLHNLGMGKINEIFLINNVGILFFGKNRQNYLRQAYITCVLYKGQNRVKVLDRKDFRDDPVTDYENSFKFLQQHLRLEYEIKTGGPRIEIPEIPYEALREGLLNAIMHRDYLEEGARVMVEIFDNRVEISNPGELLFDKARFGRTSIARNPVIFDLFYRLGLIEKIGSGINRIRDAIAERGLNVKFEIDDFFTIIFQRHQSMKEYTTSLKKAQVEVEVEKAQAEQAADIEVDMGEAQAKLKKAQANNKIELTDTENKILALCAQSSISSREIFLQLGHSIRSGSYKKSLNKLMKIGLLTQTIPDKPTSPNQKYKTTDKMMKILMNE